MIEEGRCLDCLDKLTEKEMTVNLKTKLQQISDVAWLVSQGDKKIGILNRDVQDHFTFISGQTIEIFADDKEVTKHFGNITLFEDQITEPLTAPDSFYICGYLVDYISPIPVDSSDPNYIEELPLYLKTSNSNVYYAAGWYCINFEKGWKHSHSPKLATLLKYGYEGPYKTELDCRAVMKRLNKARS